MVAALVGTRAAPRTVGHGIELSAGGVATAILIRDGATIRQIPLEPTPFGFPVVQPLRSGGVLIVESRVRVDEPPNASVFDAAGRLVRRAMFGDGIEHVHVDAEDRAWVGYFDEGVFGNFGWGRGAGPEPIGSSGLNRFDLDTGELVWSFEPPPGSDFIADCYALNVATDAVWIYYYTDFDLMRIAADGSVRRWRTQTSGAHALAVDGARALLVGSYGKPLSATLCRLSNASVTAISKVDIRHADGRVPSGKVVGRGDALYAVEGPRCFGASLRNFSVGSA